jgi:16S rRNA (guanine966-N2)-methyltransferase
VRVIAGKLRGRRLVAPRGRGTRPTADRVRQALFDVLGLIEGARTLDLFAGTGALGIEALSRGAAHAVFVEAGPAALAALRKNLQALRLAERATLLPLPVERARPALARLGSFDLVLCDPPWPDAVRVAGNVARWLAGNLTPGARVVLGHRDKDAPAVAPGGGLQLVERRAWGDSGMSFFRAPAQALG